MAKDKGPEPYKMPYVEVGMVVWWYDCLGAADGFCAVVTSIGNDNIGLAVLGPGYHNFLPKEGVRHKNHPNKELIRAADVGVWDYTPTGRKLIDLLGVQ